MKSDLFFFFFFFLDKSKAFEEFDIEDFFINWNKRVLKGP